MKQIKEAHEKVGATYLSRSWQYQPTSADIKVQSFPVYADVSELPDSSTAGLLGNPNAVDSSRFEWDSKSWSYKMKIPTDKKYFELEDIVLIPRVVSTIAHRADVDTSVRLNGEVMKLPLISAPMPDVTGWKMAAELARLGGLGIIHRFQSVEDQCKEWHVASLRAVETEGTFHEVGAAIGTKAEDFSRLEPLYGEGCRVICVDTANGASEATLKMVEEVKYRYPDVFVISGNVGSAETFSKLEAAGCDAIRVGIGTGRNCETATETGIYSPLGSLLVSCRLDRKRSLIIADGGIRKPSHFVKALTLGADLVMAGGIFAGCEESPGEVIVNEGQKYKIYRGAASYGVQAQVGKKPIYNEGRESLIPYTGEVEKIYRRYENGLRSAMSYFNARTLKEFKENVTWGYL